MEAEAGRGAADGPEAVADSAAAGAVVVVPVEDGRLMGNWQRAHPISQYPISPAQTLSRRI